MLPKSVVIQCVVDVVSDVKLEDNEDKPNLVVDYVLTEGDQPQVA